MAVAIESYGYPAVFDTAGEVIEGAITSQIGAKYWPMIQAGRFSVAGMDDWKVTPQVGIDRGIRVGAGTISGDAVMDTLPTYDTFSLPAVDTGSRWFLVAARRSWGSPSLTAIKFIEGTATRTLPARSDAPGLESDQPLALCRVDSTSTVVQEIVDLRVIGGNRILDKLALEYLGQPGARVALDNTDWAYVVDGNNQYAWQRFGHKAKVYDVPFTKLSGSADFVIAECKIPDPGFPYIVQGYATVEAATASDSRWDIRLTWDSRGWLDVAPGPPVRPFWKVAGAGREVISGPSNVGLYAHKSYGSGSFNVAATNRLFRVVVTPA